MTWWILGLMACSGGTPGAESEVEGAVVLPGDEAAPADARLIVRLEDVSRMDAAAEVIGELELTGAGPGPFSFQIPFDGEDVDPRHTYSLRARIEDGEGRLLFINTQQVPVLTRDAPRADVTVPVETVARPARPVWAEPRPDGAPTFRGAGNEPGWTVELRPGQRIEVVWDYGESKAALPWPERVQAKGEGQVIRATTEAHDLSVAIWEEPCQDTMADRTWGFRVELTLDGRVLSGCGDLQEE